MNAKTKTKKITVPGLLARKKKGRKIVMVTAYDATFARLLDSSTVDVLLVGDSLGMVIQGNDNTIPVTIEEMAYHSRAVSRGTNRAHLCCDLPFMANKVTPAKALAMAGRLVQEGNAESVKLEGGVEVASTIRKIVDAGIPVVGHVGMRPQSVHSYGGFKTQGRLPEQWNRIIDDAKAVAEAGAFMLVLEGIPEDLAGEITEQVPVPTIGIGAGPKCDGQVLVCYDILGMDEDFQPAFVKRYASVGEIVRKAATEFADEVRDGSFPQERHSVSARGGKGSKRAKK